MRLRPPSDAHRELALPLQAVVLVLAASQVFVPRAAAV